MIWDETYFACIQYVTIPLNSRNIFLPVLALMSHYCECNVLIYFLIGSIHSMEVLQQEYITM